MSVILVSGSSVAQNCGDANVLCVPQDYSTIQAAANVATAGQTVLVSNGTYAGFKITRSGSVGAPVTFQAAGSNVLISSPIPGSGVHCAGDGICFEGNGDLQGVHDIVVTGFKIQDVYRCVSSYDASPVTDSSSEWPHQRITLRSNECSGSAHEGFYLSEFNNSLIDSNIIHDTGANGLDKGHCMYLANGGSDNTTIRGNVLYNCGGVAAGAAGMHFNGDASVGGDGYQTGLLIERNVIHDTQTNGLNMDGVGDSTIQDNLVYNVGRYVIDAYAIDADGGPRNLRIVNNTFLARSTTLPALMFTEDQGGHVLFNNIRVQNGTDDGDPSAVYDLVATYAQVSAWFVDPASGDYHLKSGASPINAGRSALVGVDPPAVDIEQGSRPEGGAYDMGAFEFGSVPASPISSTDTDPSVNPAGASGSKNPIISSGCGVISGSDRPVDATWLLLPIAALLGVVRKKRGVPTA